MPLLPFSFLNAGLIQPFSNILLGGTRRKTKTKRTNKKTKSNKKTKTKTKRKKNLSRKKATRRKNLSKKRPINKRTKAKRTLKKRPTIYSKKKRPCNCDRDRYYIGKEPSPKGLGYCAHCTPLNVTMKGLDGNLWENKKYTKGKRWVKVRIDMN